MSYYLQEDQYVLRQIRGDGARILDVGCGEGRYLVPLSTSHEVLGIDVNQNVVDSLTAQGFRAIHAQQLSQITGKFDYIIMSHIIEHLFPLQMLEFVDSFVDLLHEGGALIIATPLPYSQFFDDYDHVRPYTPRSVEFLFSDYVQHQKKPRNRLTFEKVWIRRWPFALPHYPGEGRPERLAKIVLNKGLEFLYHLSFGLVSRSTGWVGVLKKAGGEVPNES